MAKKFDASKCEWTDPTVMMVPRCGTHIQLTEDWNFRLYNERRNEAVIELFGLERGGWNSHKRDAKPHQITDSLKIPYGCYVNVNFYKDTVLKVCRVYIRQESKVDSNSWSLNQGGEYNSLTFYLVSAPDDLILIDALSGTKRVLKGSKKPRFWAKLADVNKIKCKIDLASMATY